MSQRFDVVVIGMGPGGEVAADRLLRAGKRVAVVERELIGGECAYWGCIPSKTLLRSPDACHAAERSSGVARPQLAWPELRVYRDYMIRHLDDSGQVKGYEKQGATVVKAAGQLAGRTSNGLLRVEAGADLLETDHVVIATGSEAARPRIDGLGPDSGAPVWTNREATTLTEIPGRVLMIGGSAVAVELGQFLARMGTEVTLVVRGARLIAREDPRVGELALEALAADGVEVRFGRQVRRAVRSGSSVNAELDDGSSVAVDVVVLGTGRTPRVHDLGLDTVGVDVSKGLSVDDHCRFGDGLWAVGDVTDEAMFTHVAKYQGRVAANNILGRPRVARYDGIPRVIFAGPRDRRSGPHERAGRQRRIDVAAAEVSLPESIARPWTYETDPRGALGLLADRSQGVLVGAWAVAPMAGEWIHQAALAIRAKVPLDVLRDQVAQFPTYTEAYLVALEKLTA